MSMFHVKHLNSVSRGTIERKYMEDIIEKCRETERYWDLEKIDNPLVNGNFVATKE